MTDGADLDSSRQIGPRRAVFVVGSGRSGTSTMSGTLHALGLKVPQPEVLANETNPKGFAEPQWVVEFHNALLQRANVRMFDGRPGAWLDTAESAINERTRNRLCSWLEEQFTELGPELVIKDPRLVWFVALWGSASLSCVAEPSYITMLRPVPEVVGSKPLNDSRLLGEVSRTAGWINIMLHCEHATRGSKRAFVRYADLLSDWTVPVAALGEQFNLHAVRTASPSATRTVHKFIDPSLHRVRLTWDDVAVPTRLRQIAEESWEYLDRLVDRAADTPETHKALDELRAAYADYFAECEAVTESTAAAARLEGSVADRLSHHIPHRLSTAMPRRARRALRQVLGRRG